MSHRKISPDAGNRSTSDRGIGPQNQQASGQLPAQRPGQQRAAALPDGNQFKQGTPLRMARAQPDE